MLKLIRVKQLIFIVINIVDLKKIIYVRKKEMTHAHESFLILIFSAFLPISIYAANP
jgi:preprotein translocase subunit SecE